MFQVIVMKGYIEPWWFLDGWQDDIISRQNFSELTEAKRAFKELEKYYLAQNEQARAKKPYCMAFWNADELEYCEECGDDVQLYTGILIVDHKQQLVIDTEEGGK